MANCRAGLAAGYTEDSLALFTASHVMAVVLGAVEYGGEVVICDTPTHFSPGEQEFIDNFHSIAPKGTLICAAAALNHYSINHTTGQGVLCRGPHLQKVNDDMKKYLET